MTILYLLPIILSFLPILMINWCAKKEDEYPNIKINSKKKKMLTYIISFIIIESTTILSLLYKNNILELCFIWIILLLLIAISFIDWNTSLIPNRYSYSLVGVGFLSILINAIMNNSIFVDFDAQLIAFFIIFVSFILIYFISKNGVGMGDVKIIAGSSIFLGITQTAFMLFISSALILIYDLVIKLIFNKKISELPNNDLPLDSDSDVVEGRVMGLSKINNHTAIVMGPFLAIAFVVTYLFGESIINWWFMI